MSLVSALILAVAVVAFAVLELDLVERMRRWGWAPPDLPSTRRVGFVATLVALVAGVLLVVLAGTPHVAIAQVTPGPSSGTAPPTIQQEIAAALMVLGAFSAFMTAVGQGLAVLAMKFPQLANAAHMVIAWGYDVGKFAGRVQASTDLAIARKSAPPPANDTRGFATLRALAVAFGLSGVLCACAGLFAAVPAATALGICVVDYVKANPGLTLLEYVAQSIVSCGGDALTVIDQLIASEDPAVASLKEQAKALKASGSAKLEAFVLATHARAGAIRDANEGRPDASAR